MLSHTIEAIALGVVDYSLNYKIPRC